MLLYSNGCNRARNGEDSIWKLEQTAIGNTRADSIPPARFSPRLRDSSCVLHSLEPMEFGCSSWSSYKMLQVYASVFYEAYHLHPLDRFKEETACCGLVSLSSRLGNAVCAPDPLSPFALLGRGCPAPIRAVIRFIYRIWTFGQDIQLLTYDQAKHKLAACSFNPFQSQYPDLKHLLVCMFVHMLSIGFIHQD